jgi:hypothetical protein
MPVPGFVVCEYAPYANGIGQPYQVAEESSYGTALNTASGAFIWIIQARIHFDYPRFPR